MDHLKSHLSASLLRVRSRSQIVQALREQIAQAERSLVTAGESLVSSGCQALDQRLPHGGFRKGTLVEWLAARRGSGVETLALHAAREACRGGGALVVLDRLEEFYPPAAVRLGIPLEAMIVVHAPCQSDNLWALDQALRCRGVAAALAWPERLDDRTFRRLQLAAEQGGGLGLLIRPDSARHEPSWADVRLWVEPLPVPSPEALRRLRIHLLHRRAISPGAMVEVEVNDETHPVHLASRMVPSAARRQATGT